MDDALLVREFERGRDVACETQDVGLGQRPFARDPRSQAVGAQVHGEVDMVAALRDGANANNVGVLEPGRGLALVAEAALELRVAGVEGLQHLHGDRGPVRFSAGKRPGKPSLAQ